MEKKLERIPPKSVAVAAKGGCLLVGAPAFIMVGARVPCLRSDVGAFVGDAVVGIAVVGDAVVGIAVVGDAVVGNAAVGTLVTLEGVYVHPGLSLESAESTHSSHAMHASATHT